MALSEKPLKFLDLSLPTPVENLALDEALLDESESAAEPHEVLRIWEPSEPFVVIGRSSRFATEVNVERVNQEGVPILRRCSGGAAIVTGPGCMMYAVVLSYLLRPELRVLDRAHCFVLQVVKRALERIAEGIQIQGTSDLTRHQHKFSGNSLRCKRDHFLYHGTILYDFPLELIGTYLGSPPRQPDYRQRRDHLRFVENFPASREQIQCFLRDEWSAMEPCDSWPAERTAQLVAQRYSLDDWNLRL